MNVGAVIQQFMDDRAWDGDGYDLTWQDDQSYQSDWSYDQSWQDDSWSYDEGWNDDSWNSGYDDWNDGYDDSWTEGDWNSNDWSQEDYDQGQPWPAQDEQSGYDQGAAESVQSLFTQLPPGTVIQTPGTPEPPPGLGQSPFTQGQSAQQPVMAGAVMTQQNRAQSQTSATQQPVMEQNAGQPRRVRVLDALPARGEPTFNAMIRTVSASQYVRLFGGQIPTWIATAIFKDPET